MENMNKILGIILLPIGYVIFIADRIVCSLLPNVEHPAFTSWLATQNVIHGLIRVCSAVILKYLLEWLI
jgi:hypothetical protein